MLYSAETRETLLQQGGKQELTPANCFFPHHSHTGAHTCTHNKEVARIYGLSNFQVDSCVNSPLAGLALLV